MAENALRQMPVCGSSPWFREATMNLVAPRLISRTALPIFFFAAIALIFPTATAARSKVYQTGKLIDLRSHATGQTGAPFAKHWECLAIQLEDISYLVHYAPIFTGGYQAESLIVGDPVEVRIRGDNMYIKLVKKHQDDDDEAKMRIVRRERVGPDKQAATCATPIAIQ
jgi:hypothetical protein